MVVVSLLELGYRIPVENKKGMRIPLLEYGRPSNCQSRKRETKINKKLQNSLPTSGTDLVGRPRGRQSHAFAY